MIPKIIHYCWFGSAEMPELVKKCIASWKEYAPDYKLMLWNESNSPMEEPYMKTALANKKWANLSNYTRLYAIEQLGGWYFDTDIELIKPFRLTGYEETCFLGLESRPHEERFVVNNAVIGAHKQHLFIQKCRVALLQRFDGTEAANLSSPVLTTDVLKEMGFNGRPGVVNDVRVLPCDYFYPSAWNEQFQIDMITDRTVCVHHNDASWLTIEQISESDLRSLIKKHGKLKEDLRRIRSGNITLKEWVGFNYRFVRRMIKK